MNIPADHLLRQKVKIPGQFVLLLVVGCNVSEERPAAADTDVEAVESAVSLPAHSADSADVGFYERVVVFMEASEQQLDSMLQSNSEGDSEIIGDDLMFYRAAAHDFFEAHGIRVIRLVGRHPLRFRVGTQDREYDFSAEPTLDLLVLYEPGHEPAAIAPVDLQLAQEYFRLPDSTQ